jgi:hypothetical protein
VDALAGLVPVSETYALLPVEQAFTWSPAAEQMPPGDWYMVAFRSVRRSGADERRLSLLDDLAHAEAERAPGFVHYFKGPTAPDGSCLSFCLWTSRAAARSAAGRPAHSRAAGLVHEMYEQYRLEFLRVSREPAGALLFEPYDAVVDESTSPATILSPRPIPS